MGERLEGKAAIVTGAGSSGPGMGNGKAAGFLNIPSAAKAFAQFAPGAAPQWHLFRN